MNAQHSAKSCEHGSPPPAVELVRYALGGLDLDPMSSAYWNTHVVKAERYYDRHANGLKQPWSGSLWINPAGADEKYDSDSLVRPGWELLVKAWRAGAAVAGWYGYSFEQLQQLQAYGVHPSRFVTLIFSARQRHLVAQPNGAPPVESTAPTHGNFLSLLASSRFRSLAEQQIARFVERATELGLGQIVRPWR